ncbi:MULTISPECIES: viroplasmin family protein [unclassified Bacillus (in: firmicutes)]|uniref:ribonuclease H1 domain-containing protein n=1 Tax=unclassified Bacillus (in: firmicutes) TaxID=185979 RepID=UPI0008F0C417|nr:MULTISPECIES: ribonuclease H family protein [unclassified Bacillus (in: firmicutes)]SFA90892.1 ribonuclease HI [Bacillus sp. UNCCL13]SFQ85423.1 ribonuclease HI [Bacillus sp. cl95]
MASKKFYVVWSGRKPGIYKTWAECEAQTKGYQGARFKSFPSQKEAEEAFSKAPSSTPRTTSSKTSKASTAPGSYIEESISVDAACSGNPGMMEYQGVATKTGQVIFHFGPILGTNNIGEFLAIVHALSLLKKQGLETTIYTDSQTAMSWVRNKKANTSLVRNAKTDEVWDMIHRAEKWLKENTYKNKILKWETKQFGEIKADFGRK